MHAPPKPLAILIYGTSTSAASAALAKPDVRKTLEGVGHSVTFCAEPVSCKKAVGEGKFDVVLADQNEATGLKQGAGAGKTGMVVVPLLLNASKTDLSKAKTNYGIAYDAAGGGLRLLPVLAKASKGSR